jgi:DNA-binding LacI/PurR family transcriptional regulator
VAVTLTDVAKGASVSTATASRALRGQPNVAPVTRERVLRVAHQLAYSVSPQASRALSGRRVVAVITPIDNLWFYSTVSTSVTLRLLGEGVETVHYRVESPEAQADLIERLVRDHLADGCVVTTFPVVSEAATFVQLHRFPLVTLETTAEGIDGVCVDNRAAAELATRHLINLGHRRIGLIYRRDGGSYLESNRARFDGYRAALERAGLPFDPALACPSDSIYQGGAEAMEKLQSVHEPPTAVFAVTDEMALGALGALWRQRLRVPDGELAAERLLRRFDGEAAAPVHTVLEVELVLRASTQPLRTDDEG